MDGIPAAVTVQRVETLVVAQQAALVKRCWCTRNKEIIWDGNSNYYILLFCLLSTFTNIILTYLSK